MSNCWGTFMTILTAERGILEAPKAVLQWTKEGVQALGSCMSSLQNTTESTDGPMRKQ